MEWALLHGLIFYFEGLWSLILPQILKNFQRAIQHARGHATIGGFISATVLIYAVTEGTSCSTTGVCQVQNIEMPALTNVNHYFHIQDNAGLETLDAFNGFKTVGRVLSISRNGALNDIGFESLESVCEPGQRAEGGRRPSGSARRLRPCHRNQSAPCRSAQ